MPATPLSLWTKENHCEKALRVLRTLGRSLTMVNYPWALVPVGADRVQEGRWVTLISPRESFQVQSWNAANRRSWRTVCPLRYPAPPQPYVAFPVYESTAKEQLSQYNATTK